MGKCNRCCHRPPAPDRRLCEYCLSKARQTATSGNWSRKLKAMVIQANGIPACGSCGETRLECLALVSQAAGQGKDHTAKLYAELARDKAPRTDLRILCQNCKISALRNRGVPRPPRYLPETKVPDLNRDVEILTEASRPGKKGAGRKRWTRKLPGEEQAR